MEHLLTVFIAGHVVAGFVGWSHFGCQWSLVRAVGSHVRYGHVFAWCAYLVTLSAVVVSLARVIGYQLRGITVTEQPEAYGFALFLGYLGLATFASVRQSIRAVETRREPEQLKTPFHQTLGLSLDRREHHGDRLRVCCLDGRLSRPSGAESCRTLYRSSNARSDARTESRAHGMVLQPHGRDDWGWNRVSYGVRRLWRPTIVGVRTCGRAGCRALGCAGHRRDSRARIHAGILSKEIRKGSGDVDCHGLGRTR